MLNDPEKIRLEDLNILNEPKYIVATPKDGGGFDQVFRLNGVGHETGGKYIVWMLKPATRTGMYGIFVDEARITYDVVVDVDAEGYVVWPEDCPFEFRTMNDVELQNSRVMWPAAFALDTDAE